MDVCHAEGTIYETWSHFIGYALQPVRHSAHHDMLGTSMNTYNHFYHQKIDTFSFCVKLFDLFMFIFCLRTTRVLSNTFLLVC